MKGRGEGIYALAVPATTAPATAQVITGLCRLIGWSLSGGDVAGSANTGQLTSPAAGAVIATLPSVPPGEYQVEWIVGLSGTLAAADANNFGLYVAGVQQAISNNPAQAGNYLQDNVQVSIPAGGASIQIKAIALGTVGAVYDGSEVVTGGPGMQAVILDGANTLGVSAAAPGSSDSHNVGGEGCYVSTSLVVKVNAGTASGCLYVRDFDYRTPDT